MPDERRSHVHGHVEVGGDVTGNIAVGHDIDQDLVVVHDPPTPEELQALAQRFREVEQLVAAAAPPEQQDAAVERVRELEQAVTADEPDLTTMEYVRNWFVRHLPRMAGAVTGLIVHPIVGKLVGAAGDAVAQEFRRRFGGHTPTIE